MECLGLELFDIDDAVQFIAELVIEWVPTVTDRELNAHGALRFGKGVLRVEQRKLGMEGLLKGGLHVGRCCIRQPFARGVAVLILDSDSSIDGCLIEVNEGIWL